jgi:hypothetical protein
MREPGFLRSHAIDALEGLSLSIASYAVHIATFPEDPRLMFWRDEMETLCRTLGDMQLGSKGRRNFTEEILLDEFKLRYTHSFDQETIEMIAESRGLEPPLNWDEAETIIRSLIPIILGE